MQTLPGAAPVVLRMRKHLAGVHLPRPDWPPGTRPAPFNPLAHPPAAHRLLAQAYEVGGGSVAGFAGWWKSVRTDGEYDPTLCFVAVAQDSGRMLGFAQCWTSDWIKDFVISPDFRRRGLGRALLLHVFHAFQRRGAREVALGVHADNPSGAVQLYRSLGMEVAEVRLPPA